MTQICTAKDIREKFKISQRRLDYLFESGKMAPVTKLSNGQRIFSEYDIEKIRMILESMAK